MIVLAYLVVYWYINSYLYILGSKECIKGRGDNIYIFMKEERKIHDSDVFLQLWLPAEAVEGKITIWFMADDRGDCFMLYPKTLIRNKYNQPQSLYELVSLNPFTVLLTVTISAPINTHTLTDLYVINYLLCYIYK